MDTSKKYFDMNGDECSIWQMVRREPYWAAVRIQEGEKAMRALIERREREVDSVPLPTHADQAELMQRLGHKWLQDNAPERLVSIEAEPVGWQTEITACNPPAICTHGTLASAQNYQKGAGGLERCQIYPVYRHPPSIPEGMSELMDFMPTIREAVRAMAERSDWDSYWTHKLRLVDRATAAPNSKGDV